VNSKLVLNLIKNLLKNEKIAIWDLHSRSLSRLQYWSPFVQKTSPLAEIHEHFNEFGARLCPQKQHLPSASQFSAILGPALCETSENVSQFGVEIPPN